MILTRRWLVLCLLLVAMAGAAGLSVAGYLLGSDTAPDAKLAFENLLFVGFLVTALILVLGVWTLAVGDSVLKRLDRLIDMARQGSGMIPQLLSRIGKIGDRISRLQVHLNDISEKRAQRISVLSGLAEFLLANAAIPLAVIDAGGKIVSASDLLLGRKKPDDPEIVGREATELIEPEKFATVVAKVERTRTEYDSQDGKMQFHPVFDREEQLALVICVFGKAEVRAGAVSGRATTPPRRRAALMRRLRELSKGSQRR